MEVISMRSPVVTEIHFIRFDVQKKLMRFSMSPPNIKPPGLFRGTVANLICVLWILSVIIKRGMEIGGQNVHFFFCCQSEMLVIFLEF